MKASEGGMMKDAVSRLGIVAVILLLFAVAVPARIQDRQDSRQAQPLRHEVSVVLKLIQVAVTDREGKPVVDLKREDFSLKDNGEPQVITEFERRDFRVPVSASATPAETPPTPVSSAPVLLPRKFILFFDFAYSDAQGIRAFRRMALDFIDRQTQPTDEIGVASYSDFKRLQVQLFLTSNRNKARDLVSRLGLARAAERGESMEESRQRELAGGGAADAQAPSASSLPFPEPGEFNSEAADRVRAINCLESLLAFAQALRYVPGTKTLVFFSGGIPGPVIYRGPLSDQYAEIRNLSEELFKELSTANVLVYPLYSYHRTEVPESWTGVVTLKRMAVATGGRFLGAFENYAQQFEIVRNLNVAYYVLGYRVNERWDGRYHRIQVEVSRPGCAVAAQAGYMSPKMFADYTELEKSIQLIDLALAENPLSQAPLRFSMAAWPVAEGRVAVLAEIHLEDLRREMGGRVEVLRLAFDAADEIVDLRRTEENPDAMRGPSVRLAAILNGRPGRVRCRFVIRDLETGRAAVAGASTELPAADEKELRLLPPAFLRPEAGVQYLGQPPANPKAAEKTPAAPIAETLDFEPLDYRPEEAKTLTRASAIKAVVACLGPAGRLAGLRLSASLYDSLKAETITVPVSILKEGGSGRIRTFFFEMKIPDVEPDEYRLFVVVEDATGTVGRIARDFVIE